MNIFNQHGRLYFYINLVLICMITVLFTTSLSAAEQSEKHPLSIKFELRLASDVSVPGWEETSLPSGGSIWISPEASINNADVLQAEPEATGDGYSVMFLLTEEGTLKFARFTKSNIGKFVAIMINDHAVSAPKIMGEITGGRALIEGKMTEEEAIRMAEGITGH